MSCKVVGCFAVMSKCLCYTGQFFSAAHELQAVHPGLAPSVSYSELIKADYSREEAFQTVIMQGASPCSHLYAAKVLQTCTILVQTHTALLPTCTV